MGSYLPTYYSKKQIEASKEIETNFINTCNNFLKKIKINKDNIKIELLEKHYKLYEDSNLKIYKIGIFTVTFKDVNNTMENITVEFNIMGTTFTLTIDGGVNDNVTISLKIGEYSVKIWDFIKSLKLPF